MKNTCTLKPLIVLIMLLFSAVSSNLRAQFTFPPDTTRYLLSNESGVKVTRYRPSDSNIIKGTLIIRFRQNALNYSKLLNTYEQFYNSGAHAKGGIPLSGPTIPNDTERGFPKLLQDLLKRERFYIDSSSNIVLDTALKNFLHAVGGKYLQRLTTASPIDTLSITRLGDTIGCDHYNWMLLHYDTTTNALSLSYLLTSLYNKDMNFAEPDYKGTVFLRHPYDNRIFYNRCQYSMKSMINVEQAWDYEVGNPKILLSHYDMGVDYMHPDLSGGIGAGFHVRYGEQFFLSSTGSIDDIRLHQGHGTPCMGIMGALTNRTFTSVAGIAGGFGRLSAAGVDSAVDLGTGCSLVILAASGADLQPYIAALFEASAKSPFTAYGYGVHVINTSANILKGTGGLNASLHGAVNYAYENGVIQTDAIDETNYNETIKQVTWPADFEEPWIICVGESKQDKSRTFFGNFGSNYGFQMDLLAPGGDPLSNLGGSFALLGPYLLDTIRCFDNGGGNGDITFTIRNAQEPKPWNGRLEIDTPLYTYGGFGGTSAAAPHVAGSAGLIISHFLNDTTIKLEPEDVQGILKASAWRGDVDRSTSDSVNFWRATSGYGHLDIGHAFQMLDPAPGRYTDNLYFLKHFHFDTGLTFGDWTTSDTASAIFDIPWAGNVQRSDSLYKFANRQYLVDSSGLAAEEDLYYAKVRPVTITVKLDSMWDVNSDAPLYAWGRGGNMKEKSGWSYTQFNNFQNGWSRVTDGMGGNDLNEGIFHSQGVTFTVTTAQWDIWGWDSTRRSFSRHMGHYPSDSMVGVNFTVFGRKNLLYNNVNSISRPAGNEILLVAVNPEDRQLNVRYFSDAEIEHPKIEVYDILGRLIQSHSEERGIKGWNTMNMQVSRFNIGTYICRVSGSGFMQSRTFQIVK